MLQAHSGQPLGPFVKYFSNVLLGFRKNKDSAGVSHREKSIRWIDHCQKDDTCTKDPRNQRTFAESQPPFPGTIISQKDCPVHDASGHLAMMKDAPQSGGAQSY